MVHQRTASLAETNSKAQLLRMEGAPIPACMQHTLKKGQGRVAAIVGAVLHTKR